MKTEAPGRSAQTANTGSVGAGELSVQAADLTESQLENLLAERRLNGEQRELAEEGDRSQTSTVHASEEKAGAGADLGRRNKTASTEGSCVED